MRRKRACAGPEKEYVEVAAYLAHYVTSHKGEEPHGLEKIMTALWKRGAARILGVHKGNLEEVAFGVTFESLHTA